MEGKQKPHITMLWIAIAVLSINQAIGTYQDLQIFQQTRERIQVLQEHQLEMLEREAKTLEVLHLVVEALNILKNR